MTSIFRYIGITCLLLAAPVIAPLTAAEMDHSAHHNEMAGVQEGGQSAFAAIQEIVTVLMNDPETNWSDVDIEALRQHLIDMDNVTLRAEVSEEPTPAGARFKVTSEDAAVRASIKRMVTAHAMVMDGANGWGMEATESERGAELSVTGAQEHDAKIIQGLGFIGIMTAGMHHQAHHLAIARGTNPHQ